MKQREAIDRLSAHKEELLELGIGMLAIFGSVARDEVSDTSDIDLLVSFNKPVGLFHFARVQRRLSEILGCPVDLVTPQALRDEMRDEILREAVNAS